jgi:hypothetical protein
MFVLDSVKLLTKFENPFQYLPSDTQRRRFFYHENAYRKLHVILKIYPEVGCDKYTGEN